MRATLPQKDQIRLERGTSITDVTHRLSVHADKDPTIPKDVSAPVAEPSFETFTDSFPDQELNDENDPTILSKEDKASIYVFPDEEFHTGDKHSSKLLKWHRLTGHLSAKTLRRIAPHVKGMEELINLPAAITVPKCDSCMKALSKHKTLPKATFQRAAVIGIRLHCDLSGIIATPSIEGGRYFSVNVDDCSNFKFVDILKTKSSWLEALDRLHIRLGYIYKIVRTDNAGECCSERAEHYFNVYRIWHEKAPAGGRQHHLNPRAENAIGLIAARGRVLLVDSGLPLHMWSFAVLHATDVLNMCLPYMSGTGITCWEKQFGKQPDVSTLKPFGCRAYVVLEKMERGGTFKEVTAPGVFVGLAYRYGKKGYCVISDNFQKMYISTDVHFRPGYMPFRKQDHQSDEIGPELLKRLTAAKDMEVILQSNSGQDLFPPAAETEAMRVSAKMRPLYNPDLMPIMAGHRSEDEDTDEQRSGGVEQQGTEASLPPPVKESHRHRHKMERRSAKQMVTRSQKASLSALFGVYSQQASSYLQVSNTAGRYLATCFVTQHPEPKNFFEACSRRDADEWIEATYKELQQFIDLEAWEPVDAPPDAHILGTRIVYKLKLNELGEPIQHKARIVVQGYEMIEGLEFFHAFSAMAHPVTVRLLIAAAVSNNWKLSHLDIKGAYLNATLKETVYARPPKGFERPDGKVYLLKRAVYGMKSAGNYWYKEFVKSLQEFGFKPITDDKCLLILRRGESLIAMATDVDDCVIATNSDQLQEELVQFLKSKYQLSGLGELKWFLGVHFQKLPDGSYLASQSAYVDQCLAKFEMKNLKPSNVPMEANFKVEECDLCEDPPKELIDEYRAKIGCLIWLQVWTRPDISYATNILARFTMKCTPKLMAAVNKVWRYLSYTKELGIRFTPEDSMGYGLNTLVGYTDASDADCRLTRRSTGGHALFFTSSPTSWRSKRHNLTGLSTMDSETVELCAATQQIKHVRHILEGLGFPQLATPVHVDNQSAIKTAENPCMHHHTKHIGRRYSFIREAVEDKDIMLVFTPTKVNIADIFTKALPYPHFVYLRTLLLNCRPSDVYPDFQSGKKA